LSETETLPNAVDLSGSIEEAWKQELLSDQGTRTNAEYVYASGYSPCARALCYNMTNGAERPPFPADVLARFQRGKEVERDKLIYLSRVGQRCVPSFSVVGQQQRFEMLDKKGRVAIVGKVDARLEFSRKLSAPFEFKAWSHLLTAKIETFDDLFRSPWTTKGGYQILSYLWGAKEPIGFLGIDRPGIPRIIPVELEPNKERVEEFLSLAEKALDHKEAKTLPPFIDDPDVCKHCDWFGGLCQPDVKHEAAKVLADPELEAALVRREELKEAHSEFDSIDKIVKAQLRNIETGLCGQFLITGTPGHRKEYTVKATDTWTVKISKL